MFGKVLDWVVANLSNLSLLAIALMIIGGFFRIPALFMVGTGFFLVLLAVLLLSSVYKIIPEFRGKIVVILILFIVVGVFLGYLIGF